MNLFEQIKKAKEMRDEVKKIQRAVEAMTTEYENGGIKVVVGGDMTIRSIEMTSPDAFDPAKPERFFRFVKENSNKALRQMMEQTQKMMQTATKGMDLSGLMGS